MTGRTETPEPDWAAMIDEWLENTSCMSMIGLMTGDHLYGKILLGNQRVIDICIDRMEKGDVCVQYMLLLRRLCNYDPTTVGASGGFVQLNVPVMGRQWVEWYRNRHDTSWWEKKNNSGDEATEEEVRVLEAKPEALDPDGDDRPSSEG